MTLIIAYLLNIIDYIFTSYWVSLYGISIEGNPLGRWMLENDLVGVFKVSIMGGLFILLGCLFKRYPRYKWIGFIPLVVYGLIVIYHITILIYISFI
jgi:hypothetical protein